MSGQAVQAADRLREKGMFVDVMQFYIATGRQYKHKVLTMEGSGACSRAGLVVVHWGCGKTVNAWPCTTCSSVLFDGDRESPMSPRLRDHLCHTCQRPVATMHKTGSTVLYFFKLQYVMPQPW